MTGLTEATASFRKEDNTILTLLLSTNDIVVLGSAINGKLEIRMNDTNSKLLKSLSNKEPQDFELSIEKGTEKSIIQFEKSLIVYKGMA